MAKEPMGGRYVIDSCPRRGQGRMRRGHMLRQFDEATVTVPEEQTPPPALTVIVPTRNEAGNIERLVARLDEALGTTETEIVFVDDSDDDTPTEVERVAAESTRVIRLLHRGPGARRGGLGGAVVAGLRATRSEWACVMDADLQHPPELVPELFRRARAEGRDLVVASRYCPDGNPGNFTRSRAFMSRATTLAARTLFPRKLQGVSDPMSGFFLIRKDAVDLDSLRPHGFKILLEIVARTPPLRSGEVPFHFGERYAGDSKASFREGLRYLSQLTQLRVSGLGRLSRFAVVGLTGLAINMIALAVLTDMFGLYYLASAILATQVSTAWNYLLTDFWVFSGRDHRRKPWERAAMFFALNNAALLVRGPILFVLTSMLGVNYLVSNFISLAAMTLLRYLVADLWIWGGVLKRRQLAAFFYDIHGIVTVSSDVRLPELERFRRDESGVQAMIRVRTGRLRANHEPELVAALSPNVVEYDERLGPLGFGVRITARSSIEVLASSLLRRSPHVLYTNVVEPILRWTFVEKGYALVHGACLTAGEEAYMITARTDTGKTTTILKTLAHSPSCGFVSDDLTLVAPDGSVLTYPKPLTISSHTVAALENTQLTRRQKLGLKLQSRIHSRSGRKFAFLLTRSGLPVATINAIVQLLVPPPKYHVERLVPGVLTAERGKLAGLVVITRGGDGERILPEEEALEILLQNCEDAYGFPPYDQIEHFLHSRNGADLREIERSIIREALRGRPTSLLASSTMDWYRHLPGVIANGHAARSPLQKDAYDENGMPAPIELSPRMGLVE
jgi:dolichol-phosphate mannosyltransferase